MIVVALILYTVGVLGKFVCSFEFELRNMSRVPIVIVFGATGTGKSKLAIKIAQKFNGEIISADSMQVYKGLDIASNKVTQAERAEARHHMLDILKPTDRYTVTDYRNQALHIIDDILKRKKLPVIVGGTNYYIESLLWQMLVSPIENKSDLTYEHVEVLKNPKCINKWKTYRGSVLPHRNQTHQKPLTAGCDKKTDSDKNVTKEDVNLLIEQIKSVNYEFVNSLKDVQNTLNIAYKFYKRTLYGLGSDLDDSRELTNRSREPADSDIVDIVKIEDTVLKEYISRNLEHAVDFLSRLSASTNIADDDVAKSPALSDADLLEDLNLKNSYAVLSNNRKLTESDDFSFLSGSRFWNVPIVCDVLNDTVASRGYEEYANRIRGICESQQHLLLSCYKIFKKFFDCVIAMTTIRIKRLNLIRVVDDCTLLDFDNDDLVAELEIVDPVFLQSVHPNNRRKTIRALQVYFGNGQTMSDLLNQQRQLEGASTIFGPLRFQEACLLWLHCDQEVLNDRLTERVDEMMETGLIEELLEFHKQYNIQRLAQNYDVDYSKGIFQSIGLKEFHPYLMLSEELRASDIGKKLLEEGIRALKIATIRYSKAQNRHTINRFVRVPKTKKVPPIFKLNVTDLDKWYENVESKAFSIVESYVNGSDMYTLEHSPLANQEADAIRFETGQFYCDVCERLFVGAYQWQIHSSSKSHRKAVYVKKVKELKKKFASLKKPEKRKAAEDVPPQCDHSVESS